MTMRLSVMRTAVAAPESWNQERSAQTILSIQMSYMTIGIGFVLQIMNSRIQLNNESKGGRHIIQFGGMGFITIK